jgi:hypothetical protein
MCFSIGRRNGGENPQLFEVIVDWAGRLGRDDPFYAFRQ